MPEHGPVAEALARLERAGLSSHVVGVDAVGPIEDERIEVLIRAGTVGAVEGRIRELFSDLQCDCRVVRPTHGVLYHAGQRNQGWPKPRA